MGIARDTSTVISNDGTGTSVSGSHTCTGTNLILFATVWIDGTHTISSVTYNSVAMTSVDQQTSGANRLAVFYLINPATGSNTLQANFNASVSNAYVLASSYTGAKQSGQPDSSNKSLATSGPSPYSLSTTVVASGCWLYHGYADPSTTSTPSAPMVERNAASLGVQHADSNGTVGTGSVTSTWTWTGANRAPYSVLVSFAPVPVTNNAFLSLM